jgi:hypothetical protein
MKPGDTVQIRQQDIATVKLGEAPKPVNFWIYARVHAVNPNGAFVEIEHPGNIAHGTRVFVLGENLRTLEDVQALHDAHPDRGLEKLDFFVESHRELNNLRAALERLKPEEEKTA